MVGRVTYSEGSEDCCIYNVRWVIVNPDPLRVMQYAGRKVGEQSRDSGYPARRQNPRA